MKSSHRWFLTRRCDHAAQCYGEESLGLIGSRRAHSCAAELKLRWKQGRSHLKPCHGPQVYSHRHSAFVNSFHLADDKWPMSVVNMWQLNELQVTENKLADVDILELSGFSLVKSLKVLCLRTP